MDCLRNHTALYKQYKRDTELIEGWLLEHSVSPSSTKWKGKAKYTINVADLPRMAGIIASLKPAVTIPTALDDTFSRAIETRQQFNDWYRQHNQDESESNQRHSHFINVLRDTWEILRPLERERTSKASRQSRPQKGQPGQSHKKSVHLANRFSVLPVYTSPEQPSATASDTTAESDYVPRNVVPAAIIKGEEDIEYGFFVAMHSFFRHLQHLRNLLRYEYWSS